MVGIPPATGRRTVKAWISFYFRFSGFNIVLVVVDWWPFPPKVKWITIFDTQTQTNIRKEKMGLYLKRSAMRHFPPKSLRCTFPDFMGELESVDFSLK